MIHYLALHPLGLLVIVIFLIGCARILIKRDGSKER